MASLKTEDSSSMNSFVLIQNSGFSEINSGASRLTHCFEMKATTFRSKKICQLTIKLLALKGVFPSFLDSSGLLLTCLTLIWKENTI